MTRPASKFEHMLREDASGEKFSRFRHLLTRGERTRPGKRVRTIVDKGGGGGKGIGHVREGVSKLGHLLRRRGRVRGGQQFRTPADKGAKICGRPLWMPLI